VLEITTIRSIHLSLLEEDHRRPSLQLGLQVAGTALGVTGLIYGIGLVSINLSFFFWGFDDFEIPSQQAIYTGVLAIAFIAIACLPAAIVSGSIKSRRRLGLTSRAIGFRLGSAVLLGFLGFLFLYWKRACIGALLQRHRLESLTVTFAVIVFVFGACFYSFAPEMRKIFYPDHKEADPANIIVRTAMTTMLAVLLLTPFSVVYQLIPTAMGGGKSEQCDIWVSREALNVLDHCEKTPIVQTQDLNIVLLSNIRVLHKTKDDFFIWRDKCPVTALPRVWIKASQWTVPGHS
jgi:hypothetical protein